MTDEEKKELDFDLKALNGVMLNFEDRLCDDMQERVKRVRNLIEKQSKEIEELKEELDNWKFTEKYVRDNYISIDKIKAKIEEVDFMIKEINKGHLQKNTVGEILCAKSFLQSLLEEKE